MNLYEEYLQFIDPTTDHVNAITDCPNIYHQACFYSLIGTLIGRKRYVSWGINDLFPNTWTVLLGISSEMHKSTAINIPEYFLRKSGQNLVLPNDFTAEALVQNLSTQPHGIFMFSEYAHFLANLEREYNFGLRALITALYDSPSIYQSATIGRGQVELRNICLNMLAASTPQWLRTTEQNMEGGLMTRTFFVHASPDDKKFKQYFPVRYDNDRFQKLSMKFANILNYPHPIEYIVKDKIKDLYREIVDDIDLITAEAPQIRTLFARANVFLMKYSMIIQTVINPDSTEISELAMCQAGDFVKEVVKRMIPIFCEIPTNRDEEKINKVLRFIKEGDDEDTPFITRSKLLRRSHLLARDLDNIIDTLVESKQIYVKEGAFGHVQYHVETMPELTEMAQIRKFLREGK